MNLLVRRRLLLAAVLAGLAALGLFILFQLEAPTTWPKREAQVFGIASETLGALADALGNQSSGVVIKDGALIYAWGEAEAPADWGSATKPFVSTLLLFAIHEGILRSVDQPVSDFVSGLRPEDRSMTFSHLANMTSGYSLPETPGLAWEYNDYAIKLYFSSFFEKVLKLAPEDEAAANAFVKHPERLGPLGFEDGRVFKTKKGVPRLYMSPRDFARVGWFWCTKGRWQGRQLLSKELLIAYLAPAVPADLPRSRGGPPDDYLGLASAGGGNSIPELKVGPGVYGFNWWFNTDRTLWPDLPSDTFQANGHFNWEALTAIPSLGLVVAWVGAYDLFKGAEGWTDPINETLKPIVRALRANGGVKAC